MTAMARTLRTCVSLSVLAALAVPAAQAQSVGYGDVTGSGGSDRASGTSSDGGEAATSKRARRANRQGGKAVTVQPYIELNQIVDAELSPGDDVLTYTQAVAGVDATIAGRNSAASASVRYEYHQGWSKRAGEGDSITGLVSGYTTAAPGLTLNVAGIAARASNSGEGGGFGGVYSRENADSTVYAVQGGPSYVARVGDLDLAANYRAGYTKIDTDFDDADLGEAGLTFRPETFDESVTHVADVQAGFAPGTVAPVGVAAAGSFYQENVSNLDQRLRDMQARGIVTVPIGTDVQVSGAVGYENVEVSARDAVRDANGVPIVRRNGRYVTDKSAPRLIAYETDGLIWDVGVSWRPSRRTYATAHVGRRYGATNYTGSFTWAPTARQTLSVGVYHTISAFGGNLGRVLDNLPDEFLAVRDPITGDLGGCVSSLEGNNCLTGAFTALRSSVFRSRGVAASYNWRFGAIDAGLGIGYDTRKYIGAPGTVLAGTDGQRDETLWLVANLGWTINDDSGWLANAYANRVSRDDVVGDISNVGLTTAYYRNVTAHLRAHAAVGIDGSMGEGDYRDFWNATGLVGMRYNF
jgi:hypothetical protein